jgi:hypothetical protein
MVYFVQVFVQLFLHVLIEVFKLTVVCMAQQFYGSGKFLLFWINILQSLTTKMLKLEHMARLKDIRVQDLLTRLGKAGLLTPEDYKQKSKDGGVPADEWD